MDDTSYARADPGAGALLFPVRSDPHRSPDHTLSLVCWKRLPPAVSALMWVVVGGDGLSIILLDTMLSPSSCL